MGKIVVKWRVFWNSVIAKDGYKRILSGLRNTIIIAVLGLLIGTVIGTVIAIIMVIPPYKKITRFFQRLCRLYVAFFRGTPIVVQLLLAHFVILPLMGVKLGAVTECVLVFGLNSGAYVSEIMRGGINSVDSGQLEAGRAVGLSFPVAMAKIVVPQAIKNILPTMGNEFIALIKETAVVGYVGALDINVAFQYIGSNNYEFMMPYLVMAVIYILLVLVITALLRFLERRLSVSDRNR